MFQSIGLTERLSWTICTQPISYDPDLNSIPDLRSEKLRHAINARALKVRKTWALLQSRGQAGISSRALCVLKI